MSEENIEYEILGKKIVWNPELDNMKIRDTIILPKPKDTEK